MKVLNPVDAEICNKHDYFPKWEGKTVYFRSDAWAYIELKDYVEWAGFLRGDLLIVTNSGLYILEKFYSYNESVLVGPIFTKREER